MKKFLVIVLLIVITMRTTIFANEDIPNSSNVTIEMIDGLLRDANTPENIIRSMDDELKLFIYETSLSKGVSEYIEISAEQSAENMARSSYEISRNDLEIEVTAFLSSNGTQVDIYPVYEWLTPVKPVGKDYFSYFTSDDYSVVPGERSNLIWAKRNAEDEWVNTGAATYTSSSLNGYEHKGSSLGTPDAPIYLKGYFHMKVDIDNSPAVQKMVISYVHDTSSGNNFSYTITYKAFGITVNSNSTSVGYHNEVYNLEY